MTNNLLSIIIPIFNEEKNINFVLDEVSSFLEKNKFDYEIILVNDGSTDCTKNICENYSKKKKIKLVSHEINKGIGAAFWSGFDEATGYSVIMVPCDGEFNVENFTHHRFIEFTDAVILYPVNTSIRSIFRNTLSLLFRQIINTTFRTNFHYTNGTNIYKRKILLNLPRNFSGLFQADILIRLQRNEFNFIETPSFPLKKRLHGKSKLISILSLLRIFKSYLLLFYVIYIKK